MAKFLQNVHEAIQVHSQPSGGSVDVPELLSSALKLPQQARLGNSTESSESPKTVEELSDLSYAAEKRSFKIGKIAFEKREIERRVAQNHEY